ncbi:MAG: cadherin repeat domain-containing protein [Betaproteobacteria bacterium]|nr:cadherin repeat domain-containing protein [Betaproteobacteria bacterium]
MTYSLGGTDAGKFTINATTGVVSFVSGPSFEAPSDSGGNNVYDITVTASDGSATTTQAVAITVTNVAPTISSGSTGSVTEGATAGTTVYTAAATDPAGGTVTYSLTGTDASAFTINSSTGAVTINATPNFETKSSYSFNVVASDGSLTSTKAVTVGVTNVAPTFSSGGTASVAENATTAYTAAASDTAGGTVTYSLGGTDAGKFTINATTGW